MHLHVALGVGTLQLFTVGSAEGGWQYVAAGEPFSVREKYETRCSLIEKAQKNPLHGV